MLTLRKSISVIHLRVFTAMNENVGVGKYERDS